MATEKRYRVITPMRSKDGTEYRPGSAVPMAAKHVKEFGWGKDREATEEPSPRRNPGPATRTARQTTRPPQPPRVEDDPEATKLDDLDAELAKIEDADTIVKMAAADTRKGAEPKYEARLAELEADDDDDDDDGDGDETAGGSGGGTDDASGTGTPADGSETGDDATDGEAGGERE